MKTRLHIVTLGVNNLKRSCKFYLDALGWKPSESSDENIAFYNQTGIVLGLYPLDKLAEDAKLSPERSGFSGVTLAINLNSKEEVDELYNRVIENGGKSLVEPRETFWGGYDAYFADPDDNSWEIAWNPYAQFDEHGNLLV